MWKIVMTVCVASAIMVGGVSRSYACDPEQPAPQMDELLSAEKTFLNSDSLLTRIAAYKVLLATKDSDMRNAAIKMGLDSGVDVLRAAALRCAFLTSTSMTVKSLSFAEAKAVLPGITEKAKQIVQNGVSQTYVFYFKDFTKNCASINGHYDDQCKADYQATVSDLTVSFVADRPRNGQFNLSDQNKLVGVLSTWHGSGYDMIPAEAQLN
jgi:hypothetical protein